MKQILILSVLLVYIVSCKSNQLSQKALEIRHQKALEIQRPREIKFKKICSENQYVYFYDKLGNKTLHKNPIAYIHPCYRDLTLYGEPCVLEKEKIIPTGNGLLYDVYNAVYHSHLNSQEKGSLIDRIEAYKPKTNIKKNL